MTSLPGTQKNITTFITDFFLLFCVLLIVRKQIIILTQATYKEEPQHVKYCDFPLLHVWLLYTVDPHITKLTMNACKCVSGIVTPRYNQSQDNYLHGINDFIDCSCNTHSAISDRSLVDVFKSRGRTGGFTFSCLDTDRFSALLRFADIFLTAFLCWGKTGRPKVLAKLKSLLRFLVYR